MPRSLYDPIRRELRPAADRLANARHIQRDPRTDEISWPPSEMLAVLRELKLIDEKDRDT